MAAILYREAAWLGVAAVLVSVGNVIAHSLLFNTKGKTIYNPGMVTALVLFLPVSAYFFYWTLVNNLVSLPDWVIGIALGAALNYIGILKLIDWLKDESTPYIFPVRFLIPGSRGSK